MKKQLIILFMLLSTGLTVNAQKEYRLAKATGHLKLNLNGAIVEGYDGKEIIFSSQNNSTIEVDERAKGLVPISSSGYTDNTGMGINVKEEGGNVNVNNCFNNASDILRIKVPQGIRVSFTNNNSQYYEDIIIRNIKSEIEVSTYYNEIKLENNSGPMNINTINGSVNASFSGDIKGPISIISVHNYVDITLPDNTKGNIELASRYGKLYAAKEFKIEIDKTEAEKTINKPTRNSSAGARITTNHKAADTQTNSDPYVSLRFGSLNKAYEKIKGKLNGGGIDLIFKSTNNNVYLRNK